jgi:hypothetical protein
MNKRNLAALLLIAGVMGFITLPILAVGKKKQQDSLRDDPRFKLPPKAFALPVSTTWIH